MQPALLSDPFDFVGRREPTRPLESVTTGGATVSVIAPSGARSLCLRLEDMPAPVPGGTLGGENPQILVEIPAARQASEELPSEPPGAIDHGVVSGKGEYRASWPGAQGRRASTPPGVGIHPPNARAMDPALGPNTLHEGKRPCKKAKDPARGQRTLHESKTPCARVTYPARR